LKLPFSAYVKRHHIHHAAFSVGALVAAILFFVLGAGVRLLMGPISLAPFSGTLDQAIQSALPGISLKYDSAAIEWTRDEGRVNLVVLGTRVLDKAGRVVAQAPKADIDLAAAPFLKGEFVVKRITLVGVQLDLVHMKNGGMRLGARDYKGDDDILARINDVIEAKGSTTSQLESFAVRNAHIGLYDEATGLFLDATKASLGLSSRGSMLGAAFDADVAVGGRPAHMKADFTLPPDKGPIAGRATITGLDLRGLGKAAPMFAPLRDIAMTVSLSTRFQMLPGGRLGDSAFDLSAKGEVPFAALKGKALHVSALRLAGAYDGAARRLTFTDAELNAQEAILRLKGTADLHYGAQDTLESVTADLSATRANFAMPGFFPQPVGLQTLALKGTWDLTSRTLQVDRFVALAPGFDLQAKGSVALADGGQSPAVEMSGSLRPMPVRALLRYWPLTVEADARWWIDGNIFAGTIGPILFETHFAPGMLDQPVLPDPSLKLTFAMSGVEGNYVTGLTHLTQVAGNATLTGDTFTADFSGGRVGNIQVRGGHAVIPALHQAGTIGVFTAHADGNMGDIMRLIDMKPLNYATRFGISPTDTAGLASVDLEFHVPMLADLPVDKVGISVKAAVSDFAISLGKSTRLTNGAVNFEIDNDHLHQTGQVNLADSRLTLDWTEQFTNDPITSRINVKGLLTDQGRAALNMGLTTMLRGPVGVNADLQGHLGQLRTADANVDMTPATIAIPIINLGKAAGSGLGGRITVNFGPNNNIHDEVIRLAGAGNTSVQGTALFDGNGGLSQLNLTSIKMGLLNDLSLVLTRTPSGDDYVLRGRSLDGSMIGRNGAGPAGGEAAPAAQTVSGPFHVSARLDRLAMREGVTITPFNLDLSGIGERFGQLALSGSLSPSATISAAIESTPAGRKVTVTTGDAGLLLKGLFAFPDMRGGKLTLTALLPGRAADPDITGPAPDFTGKLDIDNFTMLRQSFLSRLFSAGSLTSLSDLLSGNGITVENMDVPFSSKNNVITIQNARAVGPAVGATAEGYIDRPKSLLSLKGSISPALLGINTVLGNIPLLGDLLTSKKGEGILGVTYTASGSAEEPKISVNPLSMLTPGILRRIWEGHMPTSKDAPSNAPQPAPAPAKPVAPPPANQNAAGGAP